MLSEGMAARPWPKDTSVLSSRVGVLCFGSMMEYDYSDYRVAGLKRYFCDVADPLGPAATFSTWWLL